VRILLHLRRRILLPDNVNRSEAPGKKSAADFAALNDLDIYIKAGQGYY